MNNVMGDAEKTKKSFVPVYKMTKQKLGQVVIFNNKEFDNDDSKKRHGTEQDVESLKALLKEIGLEVKDEDLYTDYDDASALTKIKEIAKRQFEDYNCFVAVFLSHGENGHIQMSSGFLDIKRQILAPFRGNNCPSLSGKPKIFIIQACRGEEREEEASTSIDMGKGSNTPEETDKDKIDFSTDEDEFVDYEDGVKTVTPAGADFLVCYSTAEGYKAYRHKTKGSWFIQKMVTVFRDYTKKIENQEIEDLDFASIMTRVTEEVSRNTRVVKNSRKTFRQIPCTVSTLRKKIYFPKLTTNQIPLFCDEDQSD